MSETTSPEYKSHLREHRFRGLVLGTLGWEALLKAAFPADTEVVGWEAFAGPRPEGDTWMGLVGESRSPFLSPGFNARFRQEVDWRFYRQRWRLVFYSTPGFEKQSTRYRSWVALGGGTILSVLVAGIVAIQGRARWRQEEISRDLRNALQELAAARKRQERLSYDLHDGAIQSLYALQLGLDRAAEKAQTSAPTMAGLLSAYRLNLTAVIVELRGFIMRHEVEPAPRGNLVDVLNAVVGRLRTSTETQFQLDLCEKTARILTEEQAVHLANITREAISNSLRHASARTITIHLSESSEGIFLEIRDDGHGFSGSEPPNRGLGLSSMKSRAGQCGGQISILSSPARGTSIQILIPGRQPASESFREKLH